MRGISRKNKSLSQAKCFDVPNMFFFPWSIWLNSIFFRKHDSQLLLEESLFWSFTSPRILVGLILARSINCVKPWMVLISNARSNHLNAKVMHVVKTVRTHFVVWMEESAAMKLLLLMERIPMSVSVIVMMVSKVNSHRLCCLVLFSLGSLHKQNRQGIECTQSKCEGVKCPNGFCDAGQCKCNSGYIEIENICVETCALNPCQEME